MIKTVIMPKQGLQMTEGVITKWFYKEGDRIEADKPLFQMETDKLTIDIDSQYNGILLQIIRSEGETVPITEPVAFIGNEDDAVPLNPAGAAVMPGTAGSLKVYASPRAKRTAGILGLDYKKIKGSGYNGIIVERDVLHKKTAGKQETDSETVVVSKTPVKAAEEKELYIPEKETPAFERNDKKISASVQAYHRIKAGVNDLMHLAGSIKSNGIDTSISDFSAYAAIKTLSSYPMIISGNKDINLGVIMTDLNAYKMTVINNAGCLSITGLSKKLNDTVIKEGSAVFAFADFGKYGIEESFIPLRGSLQALLAAGAVSEIPAVADGSLTLNPVITLTLTYDCIKINDFYASEFLREIKFMLEHPHLLLI